MERLFFAMALTLLVSAGAFAQPDTAACEPHPAIGAAASLFTIDMPVDPVLAAQRWNGLARATGKGPEGAVQAVFPLTDTLSLTTELGAGRRDVEVYGLADGTDARRTTGDALHIQRLHLGIMRHRNNGRYVCSYVSFGVELLRTRYRDMTAYLRGAIARIGLEVPTGGATAAFVEVGLAAALNNDGPPISPGVIAGVRPTFGIRYRFR